ncbi:MAG: asparagine synthase (glutamine-hydrolyzing) [Bacteroidota bacterium]|nr:asparagine synthase (glutamine-hydrolyzing) [Bacteroidota bacterium]
MCGISGIAGTNIQKDQLKAMLNLQHHRGPDDHGVYVNNSGTIGLAHNRLSIIDLSSAGHQPMADRDERYRLVFNGEIYNYIELRKQLEPDFTFTTKTDSEVIINAYIKWGEDCLHKFIGMFAFAIWDEREKTLWAARDRLGIKPFNYAYDTTRNFLFASEIKTLHGAGILKEPNEKVWASYLVHGSYGAPEDTFWESIFQLPAGHSLTWKDGRTWVKKWYDLSAITGSGYDARSLEEVTEEYFSILQDSIKLRFRADVPVGINISGGLDSSALLHLVTKVQGKDNQVKAFTFYTGDDRYDELPWVQEMIAQTRHKLVPCLLAVEEVPALTESVNANQDEPYGGIPTLAYAKLFEEARKNGIIVLLDGQGMDEQWAGYDYYRNAATSMASPVVQGTTDSPVRPGCLDPDFAGLALKQQFPEPYPDKLRNLQFRDTFYTKIPRALRFNDRISMRASTELREPFLDHRLFELAFRQSPDRKIQGDQGKWFMRQLLQTKLPGKIVEAPKRAMQTPQREWLRGPLKSWVEDTLANTLKNNNWLVKDKITAEWNSFLKGESDNSFYIWQWMSLSMITEGQQKVYNV